MVDDLPAPITAGAGTILPKTVRTASEARIGDVEHLAALATRQQDRRAVHAANQLKALECVAGVDVKRRNGIRRVIA